MNECEIFVAALEKESSRERQTFLDEACDGNAELRQRIDALLLSNDQAGSLLEHPAAGEAATIVLDQRDVTTDGAAQARAGQPAPPEDVSLDFLAPADSPEILGCLGPYAVTGVVGRGGMGVVLKAHDAKLNRVVAIKALAPELASNPTARKRFLREARAAASVVHQHVVTIHAVDEDRLPFLVMEFIDGQSLQEKIQRDGHLRLTEVLRIGQQVAAGLAAAHAHGLMHRDVKPANILLENGVERVRITDFGLARAVDDVSMTRAGEVAGTPSYMSPEQAQGLPMDARSDLFSLGSVLYAMCTGRSPFRAQTSVEALRRVCDDTPRPIREVNPEIPPRLVAIVERLLAKQPADRFQSAAEVVTVLGQYLAEVQHPSFVGQASPLPATPVDLPASRAGWKPAARTRWLIAAAVLICLIAGLGLAEATGVTRLAGTIIRIATGQGTLIVEVNDPAVKVTVEGDGGLVITGLGLEEIHLSPGSYRVHADKDGKEVPLETEIVSITKGGREVVKVKLEAADTSLTSTVDGFNPLFNGKDLNGWASAGGGTGMWKIEDGALTCTGPRDHLLTTRNDFGDFHLRAEVKINANGNSGIYFRTGKPLVLIGDYEAQITDNPGQGYKTGSLYGLVRITESPVPPNTWFTYEIIAVGKRIRILVNGKQTADYTDDRAGRNTQGHIALQHHDPESRVFFRKIEVKELQPAAPSQASAPFDADAARAYQEAWASHLGVPVEFSNSLGMKFRLIPPGEFEMGSTAQEIEAARAAEKYSDDQAVSDALTSEGPIHRVVLSEPFYLSVTEVTQKEFETVTGENPSSFQPGGENAETVRDSGTARLPVQGTSWNDAANFCSRLSLRDGLASNYRPVGNAVEMLPGNGYRLPREAQWEFACRAGTTTRFWFGNDPADHANREWFQANSAGQPHTVASLAKNPFGLFDMHGNVSEWVQDGWNPEFYLMSKDRPAVDPLSKPKGPHQHMVRGGAWTSQPAVRGRSAFRMPAVPSKQYESNGFRVVLSVDSARRVLARVLPSVAQGAFVILGRNGAEEQTHDALSKAVTGASDGDTIEVRGNGPFDSEPVSMGHTALTIRAGAGFRPVIKLRAEVIQVDQPLLATNASLVLEGIELHGIGDQMPALRVVQAPLWATNCQFRSRVKAFTTAAEFRNCEFIGEPGGAGGHFHQNTRIRFYNCLFRTSGAALNFHEDEAGIHQTAIEIKRSTFTSGNCVWLAPGSRWKPAEGESALTQPIRLDVSDCVIDTKAVLGFGKHRGFVGETVRLEPLQAKALLLQLAEWAGDRNVFRGGSTATSWGIGVEPSPPAPTSLDEWKQLWGNLERDQHRSIRYQGGNLLSRPENALDQLTPEDFRLRPDSAGYRAGPDGKDLGADVDLVGPGAAYERWKKTPEYQQWLKDTNQVQAELPQPVKPFVVLAMDGKADQSFPTLAMAIAASKIGDTIEIRTNGPIVTPRLSIPVDGLTIRAAAGFVPVIQLQSDDSSGVLISNSIGRLVLEGLELRLAGFKPAGSGGGPRIVNCSGFGQIYIANCQLHVSDGGGRSIRLEGGRSLVQIRNSLVIGPIWFEGESLVSENSACYSRRSPVCASPIEPSQERSLQFERCTLAGDSVIEFLDGIRGTVPDVDLPLRCQVANCVLDARVCVLSYVPWARVLGGPPAALPAEARSELLLAAFKRRVSWQGEQNAYPANVSLLGRPENVVPASRIKTLAEWNAYWDAAEKDSVQGLVKFQAGDVRGAEGPTPQTFRLLPGSLGSGAANGKDLGPDLDLVGPGAAYERWQQTPEYQQWLIETKQLTKTVSATPERDAAARELAKWQGEWENPDYGRLVIDGERWSSHPKNGFEVVSTIKIVEVTDELTHVLLLSAGVDGKVRTIQTILRVDGDALHNCGTFGSIRPTEFANKPGCIYTQWKRVSSPPP
jgi:formylglycine-generating enzyme required for sulfatase activity